MASANAQLLDAGTFQTIVLIALVPAVLAVVVISLGVRDVQTDRREQVADGAAGNALSGRRERVARAVRALPMPFWIFVGANTLFSLGNSSDAFLALRTQQLGVTVRDLLLMIVAFNATNALVSFPAGALSDRFGRKRPIAIAWLIYAASYAGFAVASSGSATGLLWILYGSYYGINEAVGRAFVADVAPAALRATGFGILNAAVAVAILPASIVAGLLWDALGPPAPFWFGAGCALLAVVLLSMVRPISLKSSPQQAL